MARKSKGIPSSLRRTKAFFIFNVVLWGGIGGWYLFQPADRQQDVARLVRNAVDSRKGITAAEVAWDLWQLYYSKDYVSASLPANKAHVYGGAPGTGSAPVRVLLNTGYAAGYSDASATTGGISRGRPNRRARAAVRL
jgi:endonuclease G, mitochondrial